MQKQLPKALGPKSLNSLLSVCQNGPHNCKEEIVLVLHFRKAINNTNKTGLEKQTDKMASEFSVLFGFPTPFYLK